MKIQIFQINVNDGRRKVDPDAVQEMADSISKVGLLNPITVDQEYTLIAGLHRLEAAKMLGWTEIKCTVSGLEGLEAELAEIDENFVRKDLSDAEFRELLLRRKEIYENLHPETKAGTAQAAGMNRAIGNNVSAPSASTLKSFTADTAEKLGVSKRVVEENLQIAQNLTPTTKQTIQNTGEKVKKKDMLKLSRLPPEQQEDAASQLVSKAIKSVDEYHPAPAEPNPAFTQPGKEQDTQPEPSASVSMESVYPTIRDFAADLKNPNKVRGPTPDTFLKSFSSFLSRFCQTVKSYGGIEYEAVFPMLTQEYLKKIHQEIHSTHDILDDLFHQIERKANHEQAWNKVTPR